MKKLLTVLLVLTVSVSCTRKEYDLCIYGGNASGIVAAYSASQMGQKVIVIEPTCRIGGMVTGGLGRTDIGNKQVVRGVGLQFFRKLGAHYGNFENWIFEPGAAKEIMDGYADHKNITVRTGYHFCGAEKEGTSIRRIRVTDGCDTLVVDADWFIDCSYEGDLMAGAGVSYRIGREDNSEYGESWDGVQLLTGHQFPDGVDPFVEPGKPESGLLWGISRGVLAPDGTGDSLVQAYNYRICLTDSLENSIPIERPEDYDPSRYELLVRLFDAQKDKRDINDYFIWTPMPGRKTDINNRGGFSTDMIGMNHSYPEASWEERERIIRDHRNYTLGLLYFYATDPRVPSELQEYVKRWGLPKDEYTECGNWTPQLYVRECRRMVGEYVATQADCEGRACVEDGIAHAAYQMDSHNCQRIVVEKDGKLMVKNEGNAEIKGGLPFPISYRSITPKREECTNLLVPVCCSATHICYGSIRMEPVFMCLGQVAGMAVAIAEGKKLGRIQDVTAEEINAIFESDPCLDGSCPDIIVDEDRAEVSGEWVPEKNTRWYGPTGLVGGRGGGSVKYSVEAARSGEYELYMYQRMKKVVDINPVSVFDLSDGRSISPDVADVVVAGQTSGAWHKLADVRLESGSPFTVTLHSNGVDEGNIYADAILFKLK
ncbi:MAG: FAD-dependent oxidoreductase [Bacteroidales bacterium]|nr:FAD-dependent oxidoreductase [Bacteroidales bacterium]